MFTIPFPEEEAVPVNEASLVTLSTDERAEITFTPEQGTTTVHVPMVAASKNPNTTYEVQFDQATGFDESGIPPTDIDDMGATWTPAMEFHQELKIIIRYTGMSDATFAVQVIGWEEV